MARSIEVEIGQEEGDEEVNIWSTDEAATATARDINDYITDKINDYDKKGLKGIELYEYWRADFENFTSAVYKKTTAKTKLLRDYLLENGVWIPKNRRPIADTLVSSTKEWIAWPTGAPKPQYQQTQNELQTTTTHLRTPIDDNNAPPMPTPTRRPRDQGPSLIGLTQLYTEEKKYSGHGDSFDYKYNIFLDMCEKAELPVDAYFKAFSIMLRGAALKHYYTVCRTDPRMTQLADLCNSIRSTFEGAKYNRSMLIKWNALSLRQIISKNPDKDIKTCLQLLVEELRTSQMNLDPTLQGDNFLQKKLQTACQDHPACSIACSVPALSSTELINNLRASIVTYESVNKKQNQTQCLRDDKTEQYSTDRRYYSNRHSQQRRRNQTIQPQPRRCFICKKENCWSTRHTQDECDKARATYRARFAKEIDRQFDQFLAADKGEEEDTHKDDTHDELTEFMEDFEALVVEVEGTNTTEESHAFLTEAGYPIEQVQATEMVRRLSDKATRHALFKSNNPIDVDNEYFAATDRYGPDEFHGIMIDTGAAGKSTAGYNQYAIYERKELDGLIKRGVFEFVQAKDIPTNIRIFNSRFVDKVKLEGTPKAYEKLRLVVHASKEDGKKAVLTKSPTIQRVSQRLILCLALQADLDICTRDITPAYTQSKSQLARDFYVRPPRELDLPDGVLLKVLLPLYEVPEADHTSMLTSMAHLASKYRNHGRWDAAEELEVQLMETSKKKLGADHPDTLKSMANLASTYRNQGWWDAAEELEVQVMETRKKKLGTDHPDTLASMANLASTYRNQGRWDAAEELEVQLMETYKKKFGVDHPSTLNSMAKLASTYLYQGRWDTAEELEVQVMEMSRKKLGADHASTLNSMANLASTYRNQGRWDAAEELGVQVMETRKKKLGADHPDTLNSIANLASTYQNQGRWDAAEELEVQVMETSKKKLGADHPFTLASMANLASTYRNQGRWDAAEELEVPVMETRKKKLGADHPDTLTSMANLASTFWYQGRWDASEKLFMRVMETSKKKLGADHPSTLTSMANLASTYRDQGRWDVAEKLFVQVIETSKKKLGAGHPYTLASMANLASTYRNQGRWGVAEELFLQVMEKYKKKFGADHPDTLTCMSNLASTYRNQGRWDAAKKLFLQVMEARKKKLGADHPDTLTSMANIAWTYRNQGQWDAAEDLEVQVMETRKKKLGADHPSTLNSMANLASTYKDQGQWDAAEELEVQVMEIRKKKLGADHPSTLKSMANLAWTYKDQGQWDAAEELEVQVMETRKKKLGADHPSTLKSMANLAWTYKDQGQWDAAEELEVQVMDTCKKKLGAEHPDTLTSMDNLALTYQNQGRWKEAEDLFVQVIETRKRVLG